MNFPLGVAALVMALLFVPQSREARDAVPVDWPGLTLMSSDLLCLSFTWGEIAHLHALWNMSHADRNACSTVRGTLKSRPEYVEFVEMQPGHLLRERTTLTLMVNQPGPSASSLSRADQHDVLAFLRKACPPCARKARC